MDKKTLFSYSPGRIAFYAFLFLLAYEGIGANRIFELLGCKYKFLSNILPTPKYLIIVHVRIVNF